MREYIFGTDDPVELQKWTMVLKAKKIPYLIEVKENDDDRYHIKFKVEEVFLPFEFCMIIDEVFLWKGYPRYYGFYNMP